MLGQRGLVGLDAHAAAGEGGAGHGHEFKGGFVRLRLAHAEHAQAGGHGGVAFFFHQVAEPVVHRVHAHDGGGGLGVIHKVLVEARSEGIGQDGFAQFGVVDEVGGGQGNAPDLIRGEVFRPEDSLEVQPQILCGIGHFVAKSVNLGHGKKEEGRGRMHQPREEVFELTTRVVLDRQGLFTLLPVAGAELVGLHGIQHAKGFFHAAAHG